MRDKARENLKAAKALRDAGWLNGAANRLYYAVYQAACVALHAKGESPGDYKSGAKWFGHDVIRQNVSKLRGGRHTRADRSIIRELHTMRVRADYYSLPVDPDDLEDQWEPAHELVGALCGN